MQSSYAKKEERRKRKLVSYHMIHTYHSAEGREGKRHLADYVNT
jgi:hypothetical protein